MAHYKQTLIPLFDRGLRICVNANKYIAKPKHDWVGNPSHCIHRGVLSAEAQSRGRRVCRQAPEMDTACEDFLPCSLYRIYFTSCRRIVHSIFVLCVFCARIDVYLCCLSMIHTVYTAPFLHLHARIHMLAASIVTGDRRK